MVFEVYPDAAGKYRWRLVTANHWIIADSGQGYSRSRDAVRAVYRIIDGIKGAGAIGIIENIP